MLIDFFLEVCRVFEFIDLFEGVVFIGYLIKNLLLEV